MYGGPAVRGSTFLWAQVAVKGGGREGVSVKEGAERAPSWPVEPPPPRIRLMVVTHVDSERRCGGRGLAGGRTTRGEGALQMPMEGAVMA